MCFGRSWTLRQGEGVHLHVPIIWVGAWDQRLFVSVTTGEWCVMYTVPYMMMMMTMMMITVQYKNVWHRGRLSNSRI